MESRHHGRDSCDTCPFASQLAQLPLLRLRCTVAMSSSVELADFLDLVDSASQHQSALHEHLSDGFLALARERYRAPSSAMRLASLAPNKADSFVTREGELIMRDSGSTAAPVPSAELRAAIEAFRGALREAVKLVQAREKVAGATVVDADDKGEEQDGDAEGDTN